MQAAEEYDRQQESPKSISEQLEEAERKAEEGEPEPARLEEDKKEEKERGGEGEESTTEAAAILDFDKKTEFDTALEVKMSSTVHFQTFSEKWR